MSLQPILDRLQHKKDFKTTTTSKFKQDLFDILIGTEFNGDILEVGTSTGNTTIILAYVGYLLHKKVYSFDNNKFSVEKAKEKCQEFKFDCNIMMKDVYSEEWGLDNIGCVFIDCVHTEKCFQQDLENALKITSWSSNPIIIAHDYGLQIPSGESISFFMDRNKDKYVIKRFIGEKENWNPKGTGKVINWEGIQIGLK